MVLLRGSLAYPAEIVLSFLYGDLFNHAENLVISPHLAAERSRLLDAVVEIRNSGSVAPAYCWLSTTSSTKNGKTYTYAVLVEEKPGSRPRSKSLGCINSERHRQWQAAIANREAISELEQQLSMLQKLIERQAMSSFS